MAEGKQFEVLSVTNSTYLNASRRVIQGFEILVYFPEFDEEASIRVPNSNPATIDKAAKDHLEKRRKIAALG